LVRKAEQRPRLDPGEFPQPLGDYVLLQPLDRGGMGQVYLAKHSKVEGIEKFCVVKTLRPRFTTDADYVDRFIDEARIVVHLGHRNICQVFDVGKVAERYYLAMELIPGRDLRRVLDAAWTGGRRVPIDLSLHVVCQVLEALDYAHRHIHPTTGKPLGLVHRDVSPQNVMVNLEGEVKLIDFGLAATNLSHEDDDSGVVMGKLSYMSPEQLCGEPIDPRSDVFSAAIIAYEMLVGARFYEGLPRDEIWDCAVDGYLPPRIHELPGGLRDILTHALARSPNKRLGCDELLEELERFRHEQRHHAGARQLRIFMAELFPGGEAEVHRLLLKYATTQPIAPPEPMEPSISIARSSATLGTHGLDNISAHEPTMSMTVTERSSSGDPTLEVSGPDDSAPDNSAPDNSGAETALAHSHVEESAAETARHLHAVPPASPRSNVAGAVTGLFGLLIVGAALLVARGPAPKDSDGARPAVERVEAAEGSSAPTTPPPAAAVTAPPRPTPPATLRAAPSAKRTEATPTAATKTVTPATVTPPAAPSPAPSAPEASVTEGQDRRMTWKERIDFLTTSCSDVSCAAPLVKEFADRSLPDIPTKRLASAVAEVRRCVESCRAR